MKKLSILFVVFCTWVWAEQIKGLVFARMPWGGSLYPTPVANTYVGIGLDSALTDANGVFILNYTLSSSVIFSSASSSSIMINSSSSFLSSTTQSSSETISSSSSLTELSSSSALSSTDPSVTLLRSSVGSTLHRPSIDAAGRFYDPNHHPQIVLFSEGQKSKSFQSQKSFQSLQNSSTLEISSLGYYPQKLDPNNLPDTIWLEINPNDSYVQFRQIQAKVDSLYIYSWARKMQNYYETGNYLEENLHADTTGLGALWGQKFELRGLDTAVFYINQDTVFCGYFECRSPHTIHHLSRSDAFLDYAELQNYQFDKIYTYFDKLQRQCINKYDTTRTCTFSEMGFRAPILERFWIDEEHMDSTREELRINPNYQTPYCPFQSKFSVQYTVFHTYLILSFTIPASISCTDPIKWPSYDPW